MLATFAGERSGCYWEILTMPMVRREEIRLEVKMDIVKIVGEKMWQ